MPKPIPEYYVRETRFGSGVTTRFEVTKFIPGEVEPANTYDVFMIERTKIGFCNCPAGSRKGNDDKHVKLLRRWLSEGKPQGKAYTI